MAVRGCGRCCACSGRAWPIRASASRLWSSTMAWKWSWPSGLTRGELLRAAIAGDGVTGPPEPRVLLDVDVDQVAGARPLIAAHLAAPLRGRARRAVANEDRVHRGVRDPGRAGDQSRPPARATALLADPQLEIGCRPGRRTPRPARAIQRPTTRHSLLLAGRQPATLPATRSRRRDRAGRGRGPLAHPVLDDQAHQLDPARRSEPAPKVPTHPGPPSLWILSQDPQPQKRPRRPSAAHNPPGHLN